MKLTHYLLALLVAFLWGTNFVSMKYGLTHFEPFFLTVLRFILVSACVLPFYRRPPMPLWTLIRLSFVLGTLHFSLVLYGMRHGLNVGSVILAAQMAVPFSCLLGVWRLGDRIGTWQIFGLVVAFAGLLCLTGAPDIASHPFSLFCVVAGALAWGYSNIMIKKCGRIDILSVLGWISLFSLPQMLLLSWIFEGNQWPLVLSMGWDVAASVLFTALGSMILGYGAWYYLLRHHPISLIAPFQLLVPFFGVAMSVMMFNETLASAFMLGGALTMLGVGIIVFRKPRLVETGEGV